MSKYKLVMVDDNGRRLKEGSKEKGTEYVMAYVTPKKGSFQEKNGEKSRVFLKRPDGTLKPSSEFARDKQRRLKKAPAIKKSILKAIEELEILRGYDPETAALDDAAAVRQEKRRIGFIFKNFMAEYRELPNKKTLKKAVR